MNKNVGKAMQITKCHLSEMLVYVRPTMNANYYIRKVSDEKIIARRLALSKPNLFPSSSNIAWQINIECV